MDRLMRRGVRFNLDDVTHCAFPARRFEPIVDAQIMMDRLAKPVSSLGIVPFLHSERHSPSTTQSEISGALSQVVERSLGRSQINNLLDLRLRSDLEYLLGPITASAISYELAHLGLNKSSVENLLTILATPLSDLGFDHVELKSIELTGTGASRGLHVVSLNYGDFLPVCSEWEVDAVDFKLKKFGLKTGMIVPDPISTKVRGMLSAEPGPI